MENLAFLQDLTDEAVAHRRPLPDSCRRSHDDVQWKSCANAATDSRRLFGCGPAVPHHDEQIDIRVSPWLARGIGPEHHHPFRRKLPDEFVHIIVYALNCDHDLHLSVHNPKIIHSPALANRTETHLHRHGSCELAAWREPDAAALEPAALRSGRRGRWFESSRPDSSWITVVPLAVGEGFLNRPVSPPRRPDDRRALAGCYRSAEHTEAAGCRRR